MVEFPLNVECKLTHTVKIDLHTLFVGEIVDVQADEEILSDKNRPLLDKLRPFVFASTEATYRAIGDPIGPAFSLGKSLSEGSEL